MLICFQYTFEAFLCCCFSVAVLFSKSSDTVMLEKQHAPSWLAQEGKNEHRSHLSSTQECGRIKHVLQTEVSFILVIIVTWWCIYIDDAPRELLCLRSFRRWCCGKPKQMRHLHCRNRTALTQRFLEPCALLFPHCQTARHVVLHPLAKWKNFRTQCSWASSFLGAPLRAPWLLQRDEKGSRREARRVAVAQSLQT